MSERAVSTGKLMISIVVGLAIGLAITNYFVFTAKADADACRLKKGVLGKFQSQTNEMVVPDTAFFDGSGNERRLTNLIGRGIILNFWASWCAPCVREMPHLNRLKTLVEENNIEVLAVSQDRQGIPLVKKFLKENKLSHLEALIDKNSKLLRAVQGQHLPTTILFNRTGKEVGRVVGVAEWDSPEAIKFIQKCLAN